MSMPKTKLMLFFLFLLSCNSNKFNCPKFEISEIRKYVDSTRVDTIQAIVDVLIKNGYLEEAIKLDKKQDWEEFMTNYISDTIPPHESHHLVEHRIFLLNYLKTLKEYGYKNLAIEALSNDKNIPIFINNGVNPEIGYYTDEPNFTNLLTEARDLGYNIIRYEPLIADYSTLGNRDSLMAMNILSKWTPNDGKLSIFAGWAHIFKQRYWLRDYLEKQMPEVNIVSVNQTYFNNSISCKYQKTIRNKFNEIMCPSILFSDNKFFTAAEGYEMELIYPENPLDNQKCFNNLKALKKKELNLDDDNIYYMYDAKIENFNICTVNANLILPKTANSDNFYFLPKGTYNIYNYDPIYESLSFVKEVIL